MNFRFEKTCQVWKCYGFSSFVPYLNIFVEKGIAKKRYFIVFFGTFAIGQLAYFPDGEKNELDCYFLGKKKYLCSRV